MPLDQVAARADQGQLGVGSGAGREGPYQHLDGSRLPVEGQAERMVGQDSGVASSLLNTAQQVGGAIGLALLGTVAWTAVANSVTT